MPFGKELSHIIQEQINRQAASNAADPTLVGGGARPSSESERIALLEANLQRLADKVTSFLSAQKQAKRNMVDYGLEVIALHDLRLAVTGGRAVFIGREEPLDMPYSYLQLAPPGTVRQIRYVYLSSAGVVLDSATDPTNIGPDYIPLAVVDLWPGLSEITQARIKDIRPRAGSDENQAGGTTDYQLTGNVTLLSPDTGNDSFVVAAADPAGYRVNITSGRALVDGEVLDAPGGELDLENHRQVQGEPVAIGDGTTGTFDLYHQVVDDVVAYVDGSETAVAADQAAGTITFAEPPAAGALITATYAFGGNYMLVFLVEKAQTPDGHSIGVIGYKLGSNRDPDRPPDLSPQQHAIARVDMSEAVAAITDEMIDNRYEITNLTQQELQTGGKLDGASLKDEAITGDKIRAETITGDKILAGGIDAARIKAGAIQADHIAAGAVNASHIAAGAITADMISAGSISADKFESKTWGDMTQAMRFVKSILGGANSWRKALSQTDLEIGVKTNVAVASEGFPALRLDTRRHWDDGALWDDGQWDIPVWSEGSWESAAIDYGAVSSLQAEFWARPLLSDPAATVTVSACYKSNENDAWSAWETLVPNSAFEYWYWTGALLQFRYFKIKVAFKTTDVSRYVLLGYPEVRAANCQIDTEDIVNGAVTAAKIALGSIRAEHFSPEVRQRLGW